MRTMVALSMAALLCGGLTNVPRALAQSSAPDPLLPPSAKPGECYARILIPAQYKTETEQVLKRAESAKVAVVPARFETVDERVLVREASKRLEVVPATYEWTEELSQGAVAGRGTAFNPGAG